LSVSALSVIKGLGDENTIIESGTLPNSINPFS